MNKYVNKKLLPCKIKKSSKRDEKGCPAGMRGSEEDRRTGNDFCFEKWKKI